MEASKENEQSKIQSEGLTKKKLDFMINKNVQLCPKCDGKKAYKCLRSTCQKSDLFCPKCEVYNLKGAHFMHAFTYSVPIIKNSYSNIMMIKKRVTQFTNQLSNLKDILLECSLKIEQQIAQILANHNKIDEFLKTKNLDQFVNKIQNISNICSLNNIFRDFQFPEVKDYDNLLKDIMEMTGDPEKDEKNLSKKFSFPQNFPRGSVQYIQRRRIKQSIITSICEFYNTTQYHHQTPYWKPTSRSLINNSVSKTLNRYTDDFNYVQKIDIKLDAINSSFYQYLNARTLTISEPTSFINFENLWVDVDPHEFLHSNLEELTLQGKSEFIRIFLKKFKNVKSLIKLNLAFTYNPKQNIVDYLPPNVKALNINLNNMSMIHGCYPFLKKAVSISQLQFLEIYGLDSVIQKNILCESFQKCHPKMKMIKIPAYPITKQQLQGNLMFEKLLQIQFHGRYGGKLLKQRKTVCKQKKKLVYALAKQWKLKKLFKSVSNIRLYTNILSQFLV